MCNFAPCAQASRSCKFTSTSRGEPFRNHTCCAGARKNTKSRIKRQTRRARGARCKEVRLVARAQGRKRSRASSTRPDAREGRTAKKCSPIIFSHLRENKKVNALYVPCCVWSNSRVVSSKVVSTSRLVVDFLRLFNCPGSSLRAPPRLVYRP